MLQSLDDLACRVKRIATGWEVELRIAVSVGAALAAAVRPGRRVPGAGQRNHPALFDRSAERHLGRADLEPRRPGDRRGRQRASRPALSVADHGPGAIRLLRGGAPSAGVGAATLEPRRHHPLLRRGGGRYLAQPAAANARHPGRTAHPGHAHDAGQDRGADPWIGLRIPAADAGGALSGAGRARDLRYRRGHVADRARGVCVAGGGRRERR